MKKKDHIKLCIKDITGEINQAEKEELELWLNQSEENRREYEKLETLWQNTTPREIQNMPDVENEWFALESKLDLYNQESKKESFTEKLKSSFDSLFPARLRPVAATAIVALFALVVVYIFTNQSIDYKLTEITTANAQTEEVILPDGSTVILNSASKLSFSEPFKEDARLVKLQGEAYFSVNKNDIPFIIQTGNAEVSVLGTEFNVWSRDVKTKVIVREGKVAFSTKSDDSEKVVLTENESSEIIAGQGPAEPQKVDSEYLIGWLNSELVFDRTQLSEVASELERFYDISILIESNSLKNKSLTGSFKNEDPDSVLSMIALALDLKFSKDADQYIITAN